MPLRLVTTPRKQAEIVRPQCRVSRVGDGGGQHQHEHRRRRAAARPAAGAGWRAGRGRLAARRHGPTCSRAAARQQPAGRRARHDSATAEREWRLGPDLAQPRRETRAAAVSAAHDDERPAPLQPRRPDQADQPTHRQPGQRNDELQVLPEVEGRVAHQTKCGWSQYSAMVAADDHARRRGRPGPRCRATACGRRGSRWPRARPEHGGRQ